MCSLDTSSSCIHVYFFVDLFIPLSSRVFHDLHHVSSLSKSSLTDSHAVFLFPFVPFVFGLYLLSSLLTFHFESCFPIQELYSNSFLLSDLFFIFSPFSLSSSFFIPDTSYIPPQIFFFLNLIALFFHATSFSFSFSFHSVFK